MKNHVLILNSKTYWQEKNRQKKNQYICGDNQWYNLEIKNNQIKIFKIKKEKQQDNKINKDKKDMQGDAPIKVKIVANLIQLGVDAEYLKFNTSSFQSDKVICINDKNPVNILLSYKIHFVVQFVDFITIYCIFNSLNDQKFSKFEDIIFFNQNNSNQIEISIEHEPHFESALQIHEDKLIELWKLGYLGIKSLNRNIETNKIYQKMNYQGQNQLTQITIYNNFNINRNPNKADYSLNHPSKNILSMKAALPNVGGSFYVQVWNLDTKAKLKHIVLNEQIVYMTWVNDNILAIVTPTKVYHSDLNSQENFAEAFKRSGELADLACQVISYKICSQGIWAALVGISSPGISSSGKQQINGDIQLYKLDDNNQQPLKGYCCCFGQAKVHNDTHLSEVFAFYERRPSETAAKIILREFSASPQGFQRYKGSAEYPFNQQFPTDYPIYMQVSTKYGLLFCLSWCGFIFVYELTTSIHIFSSRIDSCFYIGAQDTKEDGVYGIAKNGNVFLIQVDSNQLIPHLQKQQHIPNIVQVAFKLASRQQINSLII